VAIGTAQISDTERSSSWHREQHEEYSGVVSPVPSMIGSLSGNVQSKATQQSTFDKNLQRIGD
jgi:hypothetical protein